MIEHLRPVSDFASIADPHARSVALFVEAGRVIESPELGAIIEAGLDTGGASPA
jgi:hypothetical protein